MNILLKKITMKQFHDKITEHGNLLLVLLANQPRKLVTITRI